MDDVKLSKTLSWLLRHGAVKEGLCIDNEGYINVNDILKHKRLGNKYTIQDIRRVVENNDKQRFKLKHNNSDNSLQIKANQGHSLRCVDSTGLLEIKQANNLTVVHGTYVDAWSLIKNGGLNRMGRNHIHFATGTPKDSNVISGMRKNCEVYIFVDLEKALVDGIKFYKSENNVILSPGDDRGIIDKKYFSKVISAFTSK